MATFPIIRREVTQERTNWTAIEACERIAALLLLTAAMPLLIASALAIWIASGRTPFIAHRRVGQYGAALWMLKLRTMWGGKSSRSAGTRHGWIEQITDDRGPERKGKSDPRIRGRFPRFLRRHSIDELPQLWHVVRGEMSLVGPRPLTGREFRQYYGIHTAEVLQVKPGLAGLWQISGRNRLSYVERCRLDLEFVRNRSIAMYVAILLQTIPEVLRGQNSW